MTGPAKFLDIILYSRNEIHQENVVRYFSCFPPSVHSSVVLLSIQPCSLPPFLLPSFRPVAWLTSTKKETRLGASCV